MTTFILVLLALATIFVIARKVMPSSKKGEFKSFDLPKSEPILTNWDLTPTMQEESEPSVLTEEKNPDTWKVLPTEEVKAKKAKAKKEPKTDKPAKTKASKKPAKKEAATKTAKKGRKPGKGDTLLLS